MEKYKEDDKQESFKKLCLKNPQEPLYFEDALNRLERENSGVRDISSYFK